MCLLFCYFRLNSVGCRERHEFDMRLIHLDYNRGTRVGCGLESLLLCPHLLCARWSPIWPSNMADVGIEICVVNVP